MTERPSPLPPRPGGAVDPLSDVLRAVRLSGAYFYMVEASGPWSVGGAPARDLRPRIMPEAEHLISYHVLTKGRCWAGTDARSAVELQAGDVIVFPHGDAHILASERPRAGDPPPPTGKPVRYPSTIVVGKKGSTPDATFVCGFFGCDRKPFNPLIEMLPPQLHMRGVVSGWLETFPQQLLAECRGERVGGETLLTRMAELMFIEVVRRYIESMPPEQVGWLAGLRDPSVGRALALLHGEPARDWSLAELAAAVATSRSALAERFATLVGQPPMQYLANWRMQLAADLLARSGAKVSAIGARVGYESEAAFSRAFKRMAGVSPAEWRSRAVSG